MPIKKLPPAAALVIAVLYVFLLVFPLCAQEPESAAADSGNAAQSAELSPPLNPKTGFPEITRKPFIMINEGITFSQVTRIEKQKEYSRSNFVRQNYLIGAYCSAQTMHLMPLDLQLRAAVYYPFYHTFNGMRQYPKQTILYAFDVFSGPVLQMNMWNYLRVNLSAGLHYMYQLSDEYHLHYLGGAAAGGLELPVAWHWTALINGIFSLDYPNLGTNRRVQPYNYAWSYQLSVGVRYSKKGANKYSYIGSKKRAAQMEMQPAAIQSDDAAAAQIQSKSQNAQDESFPNDARNSAAGGVSADDSAESAADSTEINAATEEFASPNEAEMISAEE
ncbi:MAG: hypothetical protein NC041_04330 [Bacteroides sp.]|nr:hypothetical protein [Prevotella sp.]MCM1407933.1 hypothetical protein [Treponema brennaborense]MCM1469675.1 hypothetical protein [Bacteroides sp.]